MNKIIKNIIAAFLILTFGAFFYMLFNSYLLILASDNCPDNIRLSLGYDFCIAKHKIHPIGSIIELCFYITLCFIIPSIFLLKSFILVGFKEKVANKKWFNILFIISGYLILIALLMVIYLIITIDYSLSYWK